MKTPQSSVNITASGASALDAAEPLNKLRARLSATPGDANLRLRLTQALVRAGEWDVAKHTALRLLECEQDEIWTQAVTLLAQLHEQAGEQAEAISYWERLLALDVDHPVARAHLARLNRALLPSLPAGPRPPVQRAEVTLLSPEGVVASRYEIISELGRGGTSTVFLARDSHLDLEVALKVLHPFLGSAISSEARERFFQEARLAAGLRHRGVVAVYDLDEATRSLAMEYLPLGTLRHRLIELAHTGDSGRVPAQEILSLTEQLLQTLAHVHEAGLLHGDLKPRNILLRGLGDPVLGDFGVARLLTHDPTAGGPAGTPLYFAPEQLRGGPSSICTDLFAVGAMVWEMAEGRPLRTRADLTSGRFEAPPLSASARDHLRRVNSNLVAFTEATTAHSPKDRPQDAAAALEILRRP